MLSRAHQLPISASGFKHTISHKLNVVYLQRKSTFEIPQIEMMEHQCFYHLPDLPRGTHPITSPPHTHRFLSDLCTHTCCPRLLQWWTATTCTVCASSGSAAGATGSASFSCRPPWLCWSAASSSSEVRIGQIGRGTGGSSWLV